MLDAGTHRLLATFTVLVVMISSIWLGAARAKIVVPATAVIEADDTTVNNIVAMFEGAEQAMKAHDLEAVLSLYSAEYDYHGLKKATSGKFGRTCSMNMPRSLTLICSAKSRKSDQEAGPWWRLPAPVICGPYPKPVSSTSRSTAGMKKYITLSLRTGRGAFAATSENHRGCCPSGPPRIRCSKAHMPQRQA